VSTVLELYFGEVVFVVNEVHSMLTHSREQQLEAPYNTGNTQAWNRMSHHLELVTTTPLSL
jgi:hypothetical protein